MARSDEHGFLAIDDNGGFWSSADALDWERVDESEQVTDTDFVALTARGPGLVAVAVDRDTRTDPTGSTQVVSTNPRIWVSDDGQTWERLAGDVLVDPPEIVTITGLAATSDGVASTGNLDFFTYGRNVGRYWFSPDGHTWELHTFPGTAITAGANGFTAVNSRDCTVRVSDDGRTFTPVPVQGDACCPNYTNVLYDQSVIIVSWCSGDFEPALLGTSLDDGQTWSQWESTYKGQPYTTAHGPELASSHPASCSSPTPTCSVLSGRTASPAAPSKNCGSGLMDSPRRTSTCDKFLLLRSSDRRLGTHLVSDRWNFDCRSTPPASRATNHADAPVALIGARSEWWSGW